MNYDPHDPRLTAYALGELEGAERAEFERLLAENPAAAAEVEAIRATAAVVGQALGREPGMALKPGQRRMLFAEANAARGRRVRTRRFVLVAGLAAAAALVIGLFLPESPYPTWPRVHRARAIEVSLVVPSETAWDAPWPEPELKLPVEKAVPPGVEGGPAVEPVDERRDLAEAMGTPTRPLPSGDNVIRILSQPDRPAAEARAAGEEAYSATGLSEPLFRAVPARPVVALPLGMEDNSWEVVRSTLAAGCLPLAEDVHTGGMIRSLVADFQDAGQGAGLDVRLETGACPWAKRHVLALVLIRSGTQAGNAPVAATTVRGIVEFNAAKVGAYRLIGHGNAQRQDAAALPRPVDFAGGQCAVLLYELVPAGVPVTTVDAAAPPPELIEPSAGPGGSPAVQVRVRYVDATDGEEKLAQCAVADLAKVPAPGSAEFRLAAATALFGMRLRGALEVTAFSYERILDLAATPASGGVPDEGFHALRAAVRRAAELSGETSTYTTPGGAP